MRDTFDQIIRALRDHPVIARIGGAAIGGGIGAYTSRKKPARKRADSIVTGMGLGALGGGVASFLSGFHKPQNKEVGVTPFEKHVASLSEDKPISVKPREMLTDYYGDKLNDVIAKAKAYRENNPNIQQLQSLSDGSLDNNVNVVANGGLNRNLGLSFGQGVAGMYTSDENKIKMDLNEKLNSTLGGKVETLSHELTHAMQRNADSSRNLSLNNYIMQHPGSFPDDVRTEQQAVNYLPSDLKHQFVHPTIGKILGDHPPKSVGTHIFYTKSESELEPRLAELKRQHFKATGEIVDSKEKAEALLKKLSPRMFNSDNQELQPTNDTINEIDFPDKLKLNDKAYKSWIQHLIDKMPGLVQNNNQPTNMKIGMNKQSFVMVPIELPEYSHDLTKKLNTPMKNKWEYDFNPDTVNSSPITDPKLKERLAILHKARARSAIAGMGLGGAAGALVGNQVFDGHPILTGLGGIFGGAAGGLTGGVLGQRGGIKEFNEHLKVHGKGAHRPPSKKEIGDTENNNRAMEYTGTGATLGSILGIGARFMDKNQEIPQGLPTGLIGGGLGAMLAYALAKGTEKKAEEAILRGFQKRAQEKLGAITDNKASYNRFFVK